MAHAVFFMVLSAAVLAAGPVRAQTVIINKLDDLNFGAWSGSGNMTQVSRHCVASTAPGNQFNVTITGNGPGGSFTMVGPGSLLYRVWYRDTVGNPWIEAQPGVTLLNLQGRNNPTNCVGQRQRLRVRFMAADLAAVTAGSYFGTLTLIVAPM